jgi:hypothetical protein
MSFQPCIRSIWEKVKEKYPDGTLQLTLAKTIGDMELKNIYIRLY